MRYLPLFFLICSILTGGCATQEELAAYRKQEAQERATIRMQQRYRRQNQQPADDSVQRVLQCMQEKEKCKFRCHSIPDGYGVLEGTIQTLKQVQCIRQCDNIIC